MYPPSEGILCTAHAGPLIMRGYRPLAMFVVSVGMLAALLSLSISAATLPQGFRETPVLSALTGPTAVRFAATGKVFVGANSGIVKVFDSLADTPLRAQTGARW